MQSQPCFNTSTIDSELRQVELFANLNELQLAQLKQSMRQTQLEGGEFLYQYGQTAERFFMLKTGHIKLIRFSRDGLEKVFDVISPGQVFAEATIFMPNSAYPMAAQAINDSSVFSFEGKNFIEILKDSWETNFQFMSQMSRHIRMWINEIDHLTLQNARARLISYLLYQVPDERKNDYEIKLSIPKHVVASRLSIKPETLSRILHDLHKEGFINVQGSTIYIHNVDRLRLHAVGVDDFSNCCHAKK
ncbi:MAG: Crp/Fnr family transcriptional regulator [Gammaproteobacteria bacterium]|nr:MAG: Crp/Fnr family transcriptional regulator [Gammaproteobacteria bacterium]RKZ43492.1 MAG: Crp/Fnr family transcriptional regulator [Gammaproteobacteria bacterium]RKZ73978.1 MAG: Crp/Fnr family transcriptional regulator [Gammaproteobacteria bacterium]